MCVSPFARHRIAIELANNLIQNNLRARKINIITWKKNPKRNGSLALDFVQIYISNSKCWLIQSCKCQEPAMPLWCHTKSQSACPNHRVSWLPIRKKIQNKKSINFSLQLHMIVGCFSAAHSVCLSTHAFEWHLMRIVHSHIPHWEVAVAGWTRLPHIADDEVLKCAIATAFAIVLT